MSSVSRWSDVGTWKRSSATGSGLKNFRVNRKGSVHLRLPREDPRRTSTDTFPRVLISHLLSILL